jgi:hypothetical protein
MLDPPCPSDMWTMPSPHNGRCLYQWRHQGWWVEDNVNWPDEIWTQCAVTM